MSMSTMAQRRTSMSRTSALRSPTFAVTADSDIPETEAEEWVAEWTRVLARGAFMSSSTSPPNSMSDKCPGVGMAAIENTDTSVQI